MTTTTRRIRPLSTPSPLRTTRLLVLLSKHRVIIRRARKKRIDVKIPSMVLIIAIVYRLRYQIRKIFNCFILYLIFCLCFQCLNIEGKGFNLGSYVCKCRAGYYRPKNGTKTKAGFSYEEYSCLKCSEGCDTCEG